VTELEEWETESKIEPTFDTAGASVGVVQVPPVLPIEPKSNFLFLDFPPKARLKSRATPPSASFRYWHASHDI